MKIEIAEKELREKAAEWFHEKWGVPAEAYSESMRSSENSDCGVPRWYIIQENNKIIAGLGVIENDFHKEKQFSPNICALYVEKEYRNKGLARMLLDNACNELSEKGVKDVYLITSHTEFYERCGWEFFKIAEEDSGEKSRMYHRALSQNENG